MPYAPLRRPDQLLDDPHLQAAVSSSPCRWRTAGSGDLPKLPFASTAYEFTLRLPPPNLGEHTREVLAGLGLGAAEIDALIAAKVVLQGEGR